MRVDCECQANSNHFVIAFLAFLRPFRVLWLNSLISSLSPCLICLADSDFPTGSALRSAYFPMSVWTFRCSDDPYKNSCRFISRCFFCRCRSMRNVSQKESVRRRVCESWEGATAHATTLLLLQSSGNAAADRYFLQKEFGDRCALTWNGINILMYLLVQSCIVSSRSLKKNKYHRLNKYSQKTKNMPDEQTHSKSRS